MSDTAVWIVAAVLVLILLLGAIFLVRRRYAGKKQPTDYYTLFIMGIIWMVIGFIPDNYAFLIIGVFMAVIGLAHRSEWKKNRKDWDKIGNRQKRLMLLAMAAVIAAVFAVALAFLLSQ